ncbi:helix-turn-helix domain-containing protein [Dysgonomonas sp. Marseille-P4677]|uniref:helix-turn-helix domain-containing protein n=1 Tax=Dysgonomonas sp. Marseille-P4677 TaxID=2364790 RepID=UPI0019148677|nr:helix-turn-helix domain-containing protein [Dysgonomonas sp. Marseille-P4677]MBK5719924.1 helix-turn-helix domain-containing protein [Dysgonomonas sp. Marseille-P4677]
MDENITIPMKEWNKAQSILIDIQEKLTKLLKDKESEFLTPSEVCKMLRISRNTYQRYVKKEIIEQTKIKGKAYVKRSELERLIEDGKL